MKWFHAIGICGKATGNVAKMFKDMGWFVTGSDLQFFPPMSDQLKEYNIPTVEGYNYQHLTKEFWAEKLSSQMPSDIPEVPDLCLVIDIATSQNKEYLFAKKRGIDVRPYAQILGEYLVKPESIVVTGTAGKTTTTALLVRILQELSLDPSYMIGAEVLDVEQSLKNTESNWSVMEGDEYHSLELSRGAKFLEYKPKYLIITNIGWEHQDIFPTQDKYTEQFAKAVELVPEDGIIIAHAGDAEIDKALEGAKAKVIRYGSEEKFNTANGSGNLGANYYYESFSDLDKGNGMDIFDEDGLVANTSTNLIGDYNLDNILAAFALCYELVKVGKIKIASSVITDISDGQLLGFKQIFQAVSKNFRGPKKRLEILHKDDNLIVVDDFGVAPDRAKNSLRTLRKNFSLHKIVAVFEPNSGSRIKDENLFNKLYKDAFKNADEVIIPDLSTTNSDLVTSEEIVQRLQSLGFNTKHISHDELLSYLQHYKNTDQKVLVVFFSSYRLTDLAKELSL